MATEHFGVVIVGSGVAGALCAAHLAEATDKTILILEAADHSLDKRAGAGDTRAEFHRVMNLHASRGDMHAPFSRVPNRNLFPSPESAGRSLREQQAGAEKYYDQAGPEPFKAQFNRLVGGSTWSWRGNVPRFLPSDFKLRSTYGVGVDWPVTYDDLEPWYARAEKELGVAGDDRDWNDTTVFGRRSTKFPMPAIPPSYGDRIMASAFEGKTVNGVKIHVTHTPQARNSIPYGNRPACEGNHNCIPLCPIQAKYDASVHLRLALAHKERVSLRTGCVVTRLQADPATGRITEVFFKNWKTGRRDQEQSVTADLVILAANAIETPKLLLLSNLATRSGQVGRNLMDHLQEEVGAFMPPAKAVFPFRGPQSTLSLEVFRDGPFRSRHSAFRMTIGNDAFGRKPGFAPIEILEKTMDQGLWGEALRDKFVDQITHMVRLSFSTEQLPDPDNRVELSDKLDELQIRRPKITYRVDDYVLDALEVGRQTAVQLFKLIDKDIKLEGDKHEPGPPAWNTAAHIMGTCRMGTSAENSVVDADGRCHEHANLFLAGGSVFATGATANPTMTLAALALKTADAVARA
jgi:choline dehydrogenase-like flavoprotein